MLARDLEQEQDIEQLRQLAVAMHAQIEQLVAALARKCKELESFKGSKDELQQTLALIDTLKKNKKTIDKAVERATSRKPRTQSGPTDQPQLPNVPTPCAFDDDDPDKICDACGGEMHAMVGQFEESELIDVVEVEYRILQVKRQKYACRCGGCIKTAPGPERAVDGGRYSLDFAIKIIIDKYLYHLPLARQSRMMAEHGLVVTPQTLWDQLYVTAQRLKLTVREIMKHVLAQPVMGLDQTGWPRLDGEGTKPWQMWCLTAPGAVFHRIRDDKSAATFKDLVGEYEGVIVCDALKTHGAGARGSMKIVLAGCWAHCFRKFAEAEPDHPEAGRAMEWIGKLYEIDERAEGDLVELAKLRRTESAAILAELKTWLWEQATLKSLSIGNAAGYVIANWDRLTRFVDDPRIPLDNNATERGIRGPVVGRRNHFGSRSRSGTEVASIFYSLIETAKLHDVDPREYLRAAILAADHGEVLLPWHLQRPPPASAPNASGTSTSAASVATA
ncbi:MAG: IS66 family transposase [Myxococcota bacterium]|nr:IS66 family transposase [Deltaproteobacteria bacterium]MDQ3339069.1 IS66 family transposase [Myxococcota bacterium]